MPRMDGSGPMGMGPMTGWGAGYCGKGTRSNYGRGSGGYYGRGRGFRRFAGYCPPVYTGGVGPVADRAEGLRQEMEYLENEIKMIKDEIKSFETDDE